MRLTEIQTPGNQVYTGDAVDTGLRTPKHWANFSCLPSVLNRLVA